MSTAQKLANLDAQLGDVARHPIDMVVEVAYVGEEKMFRIGVNQSVVCAHLTVLGDAIQSGMRESSGRTVTIGADFATSKNVMQLLRCVYTDAWSGEFDANAVDIYRLAHMYGGGCCAPFQLAALAIERSLTTTNFWRVVHAAGKIDDRRLHAKCQSFAEQPPTYKTLMADQSWTSLVTASDGDPIVRMVASITKYAGELTPIPTATSKMDRFWRAVQDYNSAAIDNPMCRHYPIYDRHANRFQTEFQSLLADALDYAKTENLASGAVYMTAVRAPTESFARMQTEVVNELCKMARDAKK